MTERMVLWPEVHTLVGLSRTTIWRMEADGPVPSPSTLVGTSSGMAGVRVEGMVVEAVGGAAMAGRVIRRRYLQDVSRCCHPGATPEGRLVGK